VRAWTGVATGLLGVWGIAQGSAPTQLPPLASVSDVACKIYQEQQATGLVFIAARGHEVYTETFGETAPGSGHKPDKHSVMRLCSISKVFTTDVLVQLSEEGKLRLQDPLQRFAPPGDYVPLKTLHGRANTPITLLELATHTAGLPREIGPTPADAAHFTYPSFEQRWAWLQRIRLLTPPGSAALYSNVGFDLLADAVSAAAGERYPHLLAETILKPLGMRETTFDPTPDECLRLLRGGMDDEGACTSSVNTAGSSGLYSTPDDVGRWLRYLVGDTSAGARQDAAAQEVYLIPTQLRGIKGLNHAGNPSGIGLGWMRLGRAGNASMIIEKTGSGAGFHTYVALTPKEHTAIFFAFTDGHVRTDADPFGLANNILLALSNLPPLPEEPHRTKRVAKRRR
jgi:D-alanyl-D-alanine-carboxypeptidase/D-alanyl-D-alanine-endopeptidase